MDGPVSGNWTDWSDSKGTRTDHVTNETLETEFSGISCKKLSRKWRITKNLLYSGWKSSTIDKWWTLHAKGREQRYSESAHGSDSGIARQSEFFELCERIFMTLKTASSSGMFHVPSQPLNSLSMLSRDSCVPLDTRNSWGTSGNVYESLLARRESPSAPLENPRNLTSSSCELRQGNTGKFWNREKERDENRRISQYQLLVLQRF